MTARTHASPIPMPIRMPRSAARPRLGPRAALVAALVLMAACQAPAGPPPTLEPGRVSFSFSGPSGSGAFTADGACYWAQGYAPADSACAVALAYGDTLVRIRAVRHQWTPRWAHVNVDFPPNGTCTGETCGIALDFLSAVGKTRESYRSTEATVTIVEETDDRVRGTFAGLIRRDGDPADTLRIADGAFDVPLER